MMSFRKDASEVGAIEAMMGKNIIATDNHDWSIEEIVSASLDRYRIEQQFRVSKASCHVRINPMFHWTDDKIRCHLLTCVIALACLRLLEIKTGDKHTAKSIMEQMQEIDCVLSWQRKAKKPVVYIEDPTELRAQGLDALGHQVKERFGSTNRCVIFYAFPVGWIALSIQFLKVQYESLRGTFSNSGPCQKGTPAHRSTSSRANPAAGWQTAVEGPDSEKEYDRGSYAKPPDQNTDFESRDTWRQATPVLFLP